MINIFLMILAIIFSLIVIYQLILKISEHSPLDVVVLYSLVGLIVTAQFIFLNSLGNLKYEVGRIHGKLDNLGNQFGSLASDFKQHSKHK